MIELFGEFYYIDFDEIDAFLILGDDKQEKLKTTQKVEVFNANDKLISSEITHNEDIKHKEINGVRFDLIRGFIADLGDEKEEGDSALGANNLKETGIGFKIAFNTLLAYDILKKMD